MRLLCDPRSTTVDRTTSLTDQFREHGLALSDWHRWNGYLPDDVFETLGGLRLYWRGPRTKLGDIVIQSGIYGREETTRPENRTHPRGRRLPWLRPELEATADRIYTEACEARCSRGHWVTDLRRGPRDTRIADMVLVQPTNAWRTLEVLNWMDSHDLRPATIFEVIAFAGHHRRDFPGLTLVSHAGWTGPLRSSHRGCALISADSGWAEWHEGGVYVGRGSAKTASHIGFVAVTKTA